MLQLAVGWWCHNPCMSSRVSRFICLFWVVNQQCEQRLADTPRRWVTRPRPLDFSEFLFLCQCPSGCKRQWSYGRVFHVFFHSINSPRWNWYGSLCQKALFFSTWSQDLFTFTIPPQDTGSQPSILSETQVIRVGKALVLASSSIGFYVRCRTVGLPPLRHHYACPLSRNVMENHTSLPFNFWENQRFVYAMIFIQIQPAMSS